MCMKKFSLFTAVVLASSAVYAAMPVYRLDLSDNSISYDENEVWDGIYGNESLYADGFVFSHTAPYGSGYYEGFIASRNTDTANYYDAAGWTANQWGCMAKGGVDLDSEPSFNVQAIEGKPFLINYYSSYSFTTGEYGTSYITLEENNSFSPEGIYVCNAPWGYYGCTVGDGFAQPLAEEGGYYKVTFNGVNIEEQTTKSIDFYLAERRYSDRNGDGVINDADSFTLDHWAWCDLSEMGEIHTLYITMDSSDKGDYGMNTATLVCLDGLTVVAPTGAVNSITSDADHIYAADDNLYLTLSEAQLVTLYTTTGTLAYSTTVGAGSHIVYIGHLDSGVYFVRHNGGCDKIVIR